jgi:hypothetical protein
MDDPDFACPHRIEGDLHFLKKANNYGKAQVRRGTAKVKGEETDVSDLVFNTRVAICKSCPIDQYRADGSCGQCGCPIDKKARRTTEKCPFNCW